MAKARKSGCTTVTFKRRKRGGKLMPKSKWVSVTRCEGKKLATSAKRRWNRQVRARELCRRGRGKVKLITSNC